jgi:hypothetical protein
VMFFLGITTKQAAARHPGDRLDLFVEVLHHRSTRVEAPR